MKTISEALNLYKKKKELRYCVQVNLYPRYWNDTSKVYEWETSAIDITRHIQEFAKLANKLDIPQLNEWKINNITLRVDNSSGHFSPAGANSYFASNSRIQRWSKAVIKIGYEITELTDPEYVTVMTMYVEDITENYDKLTSEIKLVSRAKILQEADAEKVCLRPTSLWYRLGSATSGTVTVSPDPGWAVNSHTGRTVTIRAGIGKGQTLPIASNTTDTLTVTGTISPVPDNNSYIEINRTISGYAKAALCDATHIGIEAPIWNADEFNGLGIKIIRGTGSGQFRKIKDTTLSGSDGQLEVDTWTTTPDATSYFEIIGENPTLVVTNYRITNYPATGRILLCAWDNTEKKEGYDFSVSEKNDSTQGALIDFDPDPTTETIIVDYRAWYLGQRIEWIVEELVKEAGITDYDIALVDLGSILNTKEDTTKADFDGGSPTPVFTRLKSTTYGGGDVEFMDDALVINTATAQNNWVKLPKSSASSPTYYTVYRFKFVDGYGSTFTDINAWIVKFLLLMKDTSTYGTNTVEFRIVKEGEESKWYMDSQQIFTGGQAEAYVQFDNWYTANHVPTGEYVVLQMACYGITDGDVYIKYDTGNVYTLGGMQTSNLGAFLSTDDILCQLTIRYKDGVYQSSGKDCSATLQAFGRLNLTTEGSMGWIRGYTCVSDDNITFNSWVGTAGSGQIGSAIKQYIEYRFIIDRGQYDYTPKVTKAVIEYYTSGIFLGQANMTNKSAWTATNELAEILDFEFGFTADDVFFFKDKEFGETVIYLSDKYDEASKEVNVKRADSIGYDYDRVYNVIKAKYGTYEVEKRADQENETRPDSIDKYGEKEYSISKSDSWLTDADAGIAQEFAERYYSRYKDAKRTCRVEIRVAPEIELGDVAEITLAQHPHLWRLGDTDVFLGQEGIYLWAEEENELLFYQTKMKVVGIDLDMQAWRQYLTLLEE